MPNDNAKSGSKPIGVWTHIGWIAMLLLIIAVYFGGKPTPEQLEERRMKSMQSDSQKSKPNTNRTIAPP
jgi:hypothetical protein